MRALHFACVTTLMIGCGGGGGAGSSVLDGFDDSPGTAQDMSMWANGSSAAAVYSGSVMPLFLASFSTMNGGTCPAIVTSGDTTTYDGGCTDSSGNEWVGHAVSTGSMTAGSMGRIDYDGFGFTGDASGCTGKRATTTWNGTIDQTAGSGANGVTFTVDVSMEMNGFDDTNGCVSVHGTTGMDYQGTLETSGPSGSTINTFNGSGRVGSSLHGVVSASTDNEVVDSNTCGDEAMSGTTTITASGHTAVITYDGATSCDTTSTVTWTYDGADQGELSGVSCSAGGGASGVASALLLLGATLTSCRRRASSRARRRARTPSRPRASSPS